MFVRKRGTSPAQVQALIDAETAGDVATAIAAEATARDAAIAAAVGRLPIKSGRVLNFGAVFGGPGTTVALSANNLLLIPIAAPTACSTDRVELNVTATGTATLARLGLFAPSPLDPFDATLITDFGLTAELDVTGTGLKTVTAAVNWGIGVVRYAGVVANGSVTVTSYGTPNIGLFGNPDASEATPRAALVKAFAYAALTDVADAAISGSIPNIAFRVV